MAARSEKSERFGKNRKVDPRSFQARFGDLVRSARARKGFTQLDVALRVYGDETKASRVSDVERGRNKPQPDTINRYCEALSIVCEEVEALRASGSDPAISQQLLIHRDIRPVPGFILIASRWSDWQDEARELPVDVFAPKVAIDYLLAKRLRETREAAGDLADRLGYLPLALSHARAYCVETNLSFDDYARREAPEDTEYPRSVHATFNIALTRVVETCPEAEKVMAVAAFLSPERIPLNIFPEHEVSEKQRDKAVGALYKLSRLAYAVTETGAPAFTPHRLVQRVMRSYLRHD